MAFGIMVFYRGFFLLLIFFLKRTISLLFSPPLFSLHLSPAEDAFFKGLSLFFMYSFFPEHMPVTLFFLGREFLA